MENEKWKISVFSLVLSAGSGRLGRVAHHEVKRAGSSFSKACISVEGNCDADGGILTCELETAFKQAVVDLIDVEGPTFFTQQEGDSLRNGSIHKAIAKGFCVWP